MIKCKNTYGREGETIVDKCGPDVSLNPDCKPWQLTLSTDGDFIDGVVAESMNIAAADGFVHKLLGVHEQEKLIDATGFGESISGGSIGNFPADNAFSIVTNQWKSVQRGSDAVMASAYIGYDFGLIKTNEGNRRRYSVDDAANRKHITAVTIMQSSIAGERASKVRVERSQCGKIWKGVQILELPDDECMNTFMLKDSVTSRFWRIRPVEFNGGGSWGVKALQLTKEHLRTNPDNIQDKILLENRDREYDMDDIKVKIYFDIQETQTDLTRFGMMMSSETLFVAVNFSAGVAAMARPFIVGDIIRVPSMTQYSATMEPVEKYFEVVDTLWAAEGYTPGWQPTLQRLILQPAMASRETQNIFGDLSNERKVDAFGLLNGDDGNSSMYADYTGVTEEIAAQSNLQVPERGTDVSGIKEWSEEEIALARRGGVKNIEKTGIRKGGITSGTTTLPPDNAPYTQGPTLPDDVKKNSYHRLTKDGKVIQLYKYVPEAGGWQLLAEIPIAIGPSQIGRFQSSDGMPPNSAPYTEGEEFPENPKDKDYHRMTFSNIDDELPTRLHRYSLNKKRWIYIESDYRSLNNRRNSVIADFLHGNTEPYDKVTKK